MRYVYIYLFISSFVLFLGGIALTWALRSYRTNSLARKFRLLPIAVAASGGAITLTFTVWNPNIRGVLLTVVATAFLALGVVCGFLALYFKGVIKNGAIDTPRR